MNTNKNANEHEYFNANEREYFDANEREYLTLINTNI